MGSSGVENTPSFDVSQCTVVAHAVIAWRGFHAERGV